MKRMRNLLIAALLAAPLAAAVAQDEPRETSSVEQMQSRMEAMREQMARIHATEDPEERRRLMREHMESMHEGMMMMREMMQGSMGRGQGMPDCAAGDTECRMEQMRQHQDRMDRRMGMMQQMMQQMMERMDVMSGQMPNGGGSAAEDSEGHE